MELVADKASKVAFEPLGPVGAAFAAAAHKHGLIIRAMADTIGICPPLIITEADIDELLARFGRALEDTAAWVASEGLASVA